MTDSICNSNNIEDNSSNYIQPQFWMLVNNSKQTIRDVK